MTSLALINFEQFTLPEVCNFVVTRMYASIRQKINIINEFLYDNAPDGLQINNEFGMLFSRMSDEVFQLMRLEEMVLFEYIKGKEQSNERVFFSTESKSRIQNHQLLIQKRLLELRLAYMHNASSKCSVDAKMTLLDADLFDLESIIKTWMTLIHQRILATNKTYSDDGKCS